MPYKCMKGHYWARQSFQPCQSIQGGHYACLSYQGTCTLYCLLGWTILNGVCVNMPNGCLTTNQSSQLRLYTQFYLSNSSNIQCQLQQHLQMWISYDFQLLFLICATLCCGIFKIYFCLLKCQLTNKKLVIICKHTKLF